MKGWDNTIETEPSRKLLEQIAISSGSRKLNSSPNLDEVSIGANRTTAKDRKGTVILRIQFL